MTSNRWLLIGAFVTLVLLGSCLKRAIAFNKLDEARTTLRSLGYFCISDRSDGIIGTGFLVCRKELHWVEACSLSKVGKFGPEWRGRVWFAVIDDNNLELCGIPDWPGSRVWGNVVAFGDADLLDEIEGHLTPTPFRIRFFNVSR